LLKRQPLHVKSTPREEEKHGKKKAYLRDAREPQVEPNSVLFSFDVPPRLFAT
jgi:hypothetical protein